jgi:hypothetical protein
MGFQVVVIFINSFMDDITYVGMLKVILTSATIICNWSLQFIPSTKNL